VPRPDEFRCSNSGQCIDASLICNQARDCPAGEDEAQICQLQLCARNNGTFRCGSGRCIDKRSLCDDFNDCINGDDESDFLCKSLSCFGPDCDFPNCPPITSARLQVSCEYKGHTSPCDTNIKPGTVAKYSCRPFHQPKTNFHKLNDEAVCQSNGKWSADVLECEPECGYLKDPVPLIVNGFHTDVTLPWHATIYFRKDNDFVFSCGGEESF
jgi:Low-density lipoprotein receptor domain class A